MLTLFTNYRQQIIKDKQANKQIKVETKWLCRNVTNHIGLANILHSKLAASANSLHWPFSELQYLRKNLILRLTINNFVSVIPKKQRHSLTTSDDTVLTSFISVLFIVNSNDFSWVLFTGLRWRPKHGSQPGLGSVVPAYTVTASFRALCAGVRSGHPAEPHDWLMNQW